MAYVTIFDQVRKMMSLGRGRLEAQAIIMLQDKINEVNKSKFNNTSLLKDKKRVASNVFIGKLCLFAYDPKWKKELPYYDKFPLILPMDMTNDGFIGLNFHYLPPKYRIALLDKLLSYSNNVRWDVTMKLKASYALLKGASTIPEIAPCFKRYLVSHVQSKFIVVSSYDWAISIFLPVEQFEKETKETVWKKSIEMLKKRK